MVMMLRSTWPPLLCALSRVRAQTHTRTHTHTHTGVVDACLIPEVPFSLHGEKGLFSYLEKVMRYKGHCVLCVAEGAGQVGVFML
jgi:hypothetical protein